MFNLLKYPSHLRFLAIIIFLLSSVNQAIADVNVYSARKEHLIAPLLDKFTEQTGIKTNLVTAKANVLLERLKAEGKNSPADILITVDAGRLHAAHEAGVLQPIDSEILEKAVPEIFREPKGHWFGLSLRARVIVYAIDRVDANHLADYKDLANERWRNRLCIRGGSNIYNQSLVASYIAANGLEATRQWLSALVENFARQPQGGDRDQIRAVAAGECDIAVVNTYYLELMRDSKLARDKEAAKKVKIVWPNQNSRGAHVNISGIALTASSSNKTDAVKLIEYLVSDDAQQWYGEINREYPIRKDSLKTETSLDTFKTDSLPLYLLGELNMEAVRLMDKAGWL